MWYSGPCKLNKFTGIKEISTARHVKLLINCVEEFELNFEFRFWDRSYSGQSPGLCYQHGDTCQINFAQVNMLDLCVQNQLTKAFWPTKLVYLGPCLPLS